jgi:DNA polymerase III alpha subunit
MSLLLRVTFCLVKVGKLDGASHPETLVEEAARLELDALVLNDHDGMCGAVRFNDAARELGVRVGFGGITFLNLEDETGMANVLVSPGLFHRFRPALRCSAVVVRSSRLVRALRRWWLTRSFRSTFAVSRFRPGISADAGT